MILQNPHSTESFSKDQLRAHVRKIRSEFVKNSNVEQINADLASQVSTLLNNLNLQDNDVVLSYRAYGYEANVNSLDKSFKNLRWAYPRIKGEDLEFYIPNAANFEQNSMGIDEPIVSLSTEVSLDQCSVILVPGVAFDHQGRRCGQGKGFYDKALANKKIIKIGIAYSVQVQNTEIPFSNHDVLMDYVVTEKFLVQPLDEKRNFNG